MTQADWVFEIFSSLEKGLNGGCSSPFHLIRREALDRFLRAGFPTAQIEEWKYTNVTGISRGGFRLAQSGEAREQDALMKDLIAGSCFGPHRLVFVDGFFREDLSSTAHLPPGVSIAGLRKILDGGEHPLAERVYRHLGKTGSLDENAFSNLNTAFSQDGAFVLFDKGAVVDEPIQIVFLTSAGKPLLVAPRVLVCAETGSEASLIEVHKSASEAPYFSDAVSEVFVGENASVTYYTLQEEGVQASRVAALFAKVKSSGRFNSWLYSFGGKLVRNEIFPILEGQGGDLILNGLTVNDSEQHTDNHTSIDHAEPNCNSTELYKGIYGGRSSGVFSGTIVVRPHAQKTNAIQSNQSLILSDQARVDSRPQLKIWADDVKCTHGATVGRLDDNALFYLRSRGIGREESRAMLIHAFASDVISVVKVDALREYLGRTLMNRLEAMNLG